MIIRSLATTQFRNLAEQKLQFHPQINIIFGQNASGKSSLLEALFFLGNTRSFRTHRLQQLTHFDAPFFRLVAALDDGGGEEILGIERNEDSFLIRLNGVSLNRRSELAKRLPILFVGPDSGVLLAQSPQHRRQFLDWGLFQNDEQYHSIWLRYEKSRKQRNAALRLQYPDGVLAGLEQPLAESGMAITEARIDFIEALSERISHYLTLFIGEGEWKLHYRKGFSEKNLEGQYANHRESERKQGFTHSGPHRADFVLLRDGISVADFFSRGQMKLATIALTLAQIDYYYHHKGKRTILLFDDLSAELDQERRKILLERLLALETQLFITLLELEEFPEGAQKALELGGFVYQLSHGKSEKMV